MGGGGKEIRKCIHMRTPWTLSPIEAAIFDEIMIAAAVPALGCLSSDRRVFLYA